MHIVADLLVMMFTQFFWHSVRIVAYIVVGFIVIYIIKILARRALASYVSEHIILLTQKIIWYGGIAFILMSIMQEIGLNLSVLLGAAGIFGVAIGFASQQAVSNLISGIFLLGEASVRYNDIISIGSTEGIVISMDLLSMKLKTVQGDFVRIPYTTLFQNNVINKSYFKERCQRIKLVVPHSESVFSTMANVKEVAQRYAVKNKENAISINVAQVADTLVTLYLDVWLLKITSVHEKNELLIELKKIVPNASLVEWEYSR